MNEKNAFEIRIEAAHQALINMLNAPAAHGTVDRNKWLETLLKHYSDRMLSDNERIWRTGALFVPISLSAFGALTAIKPLHLWQIISLAFPSTGLMLAWLVIAENHRAFQQNSEAWIIAIQRVVGLDTRLGNKVEAGGLEAILTRRGAIQRMRWYLLCGVIISWLAVGCGVWLGWIPTEDQVPVAKTSDATPITPVGVPALTPAAPSIEQTAPKPKP